MIVSMFIALYATRLVLHALGAEDYGIFNLVAGVVALLSFLNGAMTLATQRYMSYSLGAGDRNQLKKVFNSSVLLHLIIGIAVVLLLEIVGMYLFGNVLSIPPERLHAAKSIFHFMVVTAFFTIASVPYDAIINTNENMLFVAVLGIIESVAKLSLAIYLPYAFSDRLIFYGGALAILAVLLLIVKRIYCARKYDESRIRRHALDKGLIKEMFAYAGWSTIGASGVIAKSQGVAVILNVFFGAVINAAFGIANQINAQLTYFSVTMLQSLNPQIVKSEGSGNRRRMIQLAMMACKFSFFLLAFFAIPAIIEMPFVLKLWLHNIPEHTVVFCRLIIIASLINQLSSGLQIAVHAVGRIKKYQVIISILLLLNLPGSWLLLRAGFPPFTVMVFAIFVEVISCGFRALAARRLTGLQISDYLFKVIWQALVPVTVAAGIAVIPSLFMDEGFFRLLLTGIISSLSVILCIKYLGLTSYEHEKLEEMLEKAITKVSTRLKPV
ncbi:lipopolysaccharide biosynthesis protein [Chitinophaga cymbidii]|nr:MATE family efflux transporter [Chitinophaga cymbidii]